jgi:hypothetical protein
MVIAGTIFDKDNFLLNPAASADMDNILGFHAAVGSEFFVDPNISLNID